MRWPGYVAVIGVLIAIAQMIVEGPRWQMVPAYVLTGLFFVVWLLQRTTLVGRPVNRLVAGVAIGLGTLALLISAALPIVSPVFRFPRPTGPYAIGTLTYDWVDAARPEVFTADPNDHCELMVQVWYPAQANPSAPYAPYVEDAGAIAPGLAALARENAERLGFTVPVPNFTFSHLKYITTNAIPSAPVAAEEPSYPVLIFMEGLNGLRQMNTFQVEELVSHGYVVAAIDQPYAAAEVVFPDGRPVGGLGKDQLNSLLQQSIRPVMNAPTLNGQTLEDGIIPYFAQDAVFTLHELASLNQADPNGILTGHLDLQRAGIFGVSLGGIVTAEACHLEPRLRACLVMEAPMPADVVTAGLQQPSMWILSDADTWRLQHWSALDIDEHQTTMRAVFETLPGDGYFVQVTKMFHLNLTDVPLLIYAPFGRMLGLFGPIDAHRVHGIVNAYTLAFFDRHLKGMPAPLLDGPAAQYPECPSTRAGLNPLPLTSSRHPPSRRISSQDRHRTFIGA